MSSAADRKKNDDVIVEEEDIELTESKKEREPTPALAESDDPDFFDINPMRKTCVFCNQSVVTYVEHEVNPLFGLSAIACVIIFGLLSVIILPIAYMVTKKQCIVAVDVCREWEKRGALVYQMTIENQSGISD
eukprot:CAMPEP_0176370838 /NCGR_PEP_ID=MMETSP0126-20121128/24280_1 /TAXON_ID=141414 ORGANISM="Strombidinopsis acuminatum, Strain SPMC142" /NCGR_SAMPLE_ID=MMETSP0126 /ASSEMBLY_ACC=CAM_ASM_000229 /LENGTH=132 /DNA_ID=CAMNT_0017730059 /DNA_START=34 /DNA_END=433 /DNA_ORIENTATION=+